ncbi:MAG: oligosaccharide flippase family protein [Candidatus Micrarchaeia archaeon]
MFINKTIIFNTVLRWSGEILNKIIWFIFIVFLARYLGNKNFGYFSYAFSFASLFIIFTDLGTNILLVKKISENKEQINLYFSNILLMKILLCIIIFIIITVLAFLLTEFPQVVISLSLALFISAFLDPFNSLYRANKQMYYETLVMLIWRILLVSLSFVGANFFDFNLKEISYAFIFGSMATLCLTFYLSKKIYKLNLKFANINIKIWKTLVCESIPLGIIVILGGIFFKLNTILLLHFKGAQEVGWYSASFRLIEGTFFIPSFFVASVFPFFCEYVITSKIVFISFVN